MPNVLALTTAAALLLAAAVPAQLTWRRSTDAPPPRCAHYAFFDDSRGRVTIVGGQLANGSYADDCWQLEDADWIRMPALSATPNVTPRGYGACCEDMNGAGLLFGGNQASGQVLAQTLRFERFSLAWSFLGVAQPPARWVTAMALDSARNRVVLFGGGSSWWLGDTWEWDGTFWTQRFPAQAPPMRSHHAMAFDAARGRTVLFGGHSGASRNDTWVFDGTTWTNVSPPVSPSLRHDLMLAYDAQRQVVVLFGGKNDGGVVNDETWEWNSVSWTQRSFAVRPPARELASLTWDKQRRRLVLFGGAGQGFTHLSDAWTYDGNAWTQLQVADQGMLVEPPPRMGATMVYSEPKNRTTLFGGLGQQGAQVVPLNDTWESAGEVWQQRTPVHSPPASHRSAGTVVRDSGNVVHFPGVDALGTSYDQMWTWDGFDWSGATLTAGTTQLRHQVVGSLQSATHGWVIVRILTTGTGVFLSSVVQLVVPGTGQVLPQSIAGGPPPLLGSALVQAPNTLLPDRVWLVGGSQPTIGGGEFFSSDVWELRDTSSGLAWNLLAPAAGSPVPAARANVPVALLPGWPNGPGPRILAIGGRGAGGPLSDAWLFDPQARTWQSPAGPPTLTPRYGGTMTFDTEAVPPPPGPWFFNPFHDWYGAAAVLFGGHDGTSVRGEIFEFRDGNGSDQRSTASLPGNFRHAGRTMCVDRASGRALLLDNLGKSLWSHENGTWTPVVARGVNPVLGLGAILLDSYDVASCFDESAAVPLFSTRNGVFSFSFANGTWTHRAGPPAGHRFDTAMVYVPSLQRSLLFGGLVSLAPQGDTWLFDSAMNQWSQATTAGPTPRYQHALAHDRRRDKVVLFGGRIAFSGPGTVLSDTWEYDPATNVWAQRFPPDVPAPRALHTLTFDESRGRVVMLGGGTDEVQEWDGATWTRRSPESTPAATGTATVYHPTKKRVVALTLSPVTMHEYGARIDRAGRGNGLWPEPLRNYSQPVLGQMLRLGFANPTGVGVITLAPGPVTQPIAAPAGMMMCEPSSFWAWGKVLPVAGTSEPNIEWFAPNNPSLLGSTFVFQGFAQQSSSCWRATDALHVCF